LGEEELAQGAIAGCLNILIFLQNILLKKIVQNIPAAASCGNFWDILDIWNILEELTQ